MAAHRTNFALLLLLALCPAVAAAAEGESLVRKGVRLHDAGDYRACIETAKAGFERETDLDGAFYALAGSCHSTLGKPEEALDLFRKGLESDPDNSMLHFNVGITLAGQGEIEAAIGHFENAAANRPGYASPYVALGELHQQAGAPVRSLFYFMRFVTLEPNTERTIRASEAAFDLFLSGIEVRSEQEIEINVSTEGEDDPFAPLEVSRTMAAASIYVDDVDEADAESAADAGEARAPRRCGPGSCMCDKGRDAEAGELKTRRSCRPRSSSDGKAEP